MKAELLSTTEEIMEIVYVLGRWMKKILHWKRRLEENKYGLNEIFKNYSDKHFPQTYVTCSCGIKLDLCQGDGIGMGEGLRMDTGQSHSEPWNVWPPV